MLSVEQINKLESENERLTKEVVQWKHEYEMLDACCELYSAKLKELKAENDLLKEVNQSLSMLGTDLASANETVRKEFFRADKNKDMWREKAENLQKTLQEIKKIAEENQFYFGEGTIVSYKTIKQLATNFEQILNFITKAESEV